MALNEGRAVVGGRQALTPGLCPPGEGSTAIEIASYPVGPEIPVEACRWPIQAVYRIHGERTETFMEMG